MLSSHLAFGVLNAHHSSLSKILQKFPLIKSACVDLFILHRVTTHLTTKEEEEEEEEVEEDRDGLYRMMCGENR